MTPELREKLLAFGNGAEPFLQHNHFCVEDVDDGTSLVTLELQRENLNRWGAPHGGTIFAMADIAAGMAALTVRQDVNVTTSATIDYMGRRAGYGQAHRPRSCAPRGRAPVLLRDGDHRRDGQAHRRAELRHVLHLEATDSVKKPARNGPVLP